MARLARPGEGLVGAGTFPAFCKESSEDEVGTAAPENPRCLSFVGFWNVPIWISRIVSSRVRRGFPVCSGFPGPHFKHTVEALRL